MSWKQTMPMLARNIGAVRWITAVTWLPCLEGHSHDLGTSPDSPEQSPTKSYFFIAALQSFSGARLVCAVIYFGLGKQQSHLIGYFIDPLNSKFLLNLAFSLKYLPKSKQRHLKGHRQVFFPTHERWRHFLACQCFQSQSPVSPPNSWEKRKCLSAPVFSPSKWKGCFLTHWKLWSRSRMTENVFRLREKGTLLWANVIHLRKGWQTGSKINEVLSDLPELGTAIMWNIGVSKQGGRYWHLLCAMENQNLHLPSSYSPGETQQVQSHEGMDWEGRMKEKSVTLSEGLSYKHHLATPSHRKGNKDNWMQVQSRKWDFFPRK